MTTIRTFFLQIRALFSNFQKRAGETSPSSLQLCACSLPFVFSYKNTEFFVILKIELFCYLFKTLIAIKYFQIFNLFQFSDTFFLCTLFFLTKNVIPCDKKNANKNYLKHTYIFSDIKESSCGWAMNLGDEYQNFLIALIIASDEGWAMNLQQVPPNLSPATKVGDGAHRRGGNQALLFTRFCGDEISSGDEKKKKRRITLHPGMKF